MFNIYFLKFTNNAIMFLPKSQRLYNQHYILSFRDKFFVMTSKPVEGLKSTYIHSPNIEGQLNKKQYVIEKLHYYDSNNHIYEYTAKGMQYLSEHQEKFQIVLENLRNIT